MKYEYIAWDFNGTLIDDVHASLASVNGSLAKRNRSPITLEEYYSYIESPIIGFYRHLFDLNIVPFETLADEFQQGYAENRDKRCIMAGALEVIKEFKKLGLKQFILSASKKQIILEQLKEYNIPDLFENDDILGRADHYATGKTDLALEYVKKHSIPVEKMLIIGDTLGDSQVAQALGCDCILLAKGHQSKSDLKATGFPVINDLSELLDKICTS